MSDQPERLQAPKLTSASNATFTAGTAGSFAVTTTGNPAVAAWRRDVQGQRRREGHARGDAGRGQRGHLRPDDQRRQRRRSAGVADVQAGRHSAACDHRYAAGFGAGQPGGSGRPGDADVRSLRKSAKGVSLPVSCAPGTACALSGRLTAILKRNGATKRVAVGRRALTVAGGGTGVLKVILNPQGRRLVAKSRKLKVTMDGTPVFLEQVSLLKRRH